MSSRASIFDAEDIDVAGFKPAAAARPRDPEAIAAVRQTAEAKGFASREATPPAAPKPEAAPVAPVPLVQEARLRRRRTGRDKQLNLKVTEQVLNRFYVIADAKGWVLGEAFEYAVTALEAALKDTAH